MAACNSNGEVMVECCACSRRHAYSDLKLRWPLVRDLFGLFKPQGFLCTDQDASSESILSWFVRCWSIEVTFAEVRRHLGVETQRRWSDRAVAQMTLVLLGLHDLVTG